MIAVTFEKQKILNFFYSSTWKVIMGCTRWSKVYVSLKCASYFSGKMLSLEKTFRYSWSVIIFEKNFNNNEFTARNFRSKYVRKNDLTSSLVKRSLKNSGRLNQIGIFMFTRSNWLQDIDIDDLWFQQDGATRHTVQE